MANRIMRGPSLVGNKLRVGLPPPNKGKPSPMRGAIIKPRPSFVCAYCGAAFTLPLWVVRQNVSVSGNRFCSKRCHGQYKRDRESGENARDWVGGPATYRGRSWLKARAAAVESSGGVCAFCGKVVGRSIPVHHIRPFREFASETEANHPSNLVCACQSCHMKHEPRPVRA